MFCHEDEEIAVVDIAHKYYVAQEVLLLVCSIIYASSFYGVTSLVLRNLVFMQGIHKRMVQFQKLTRNLFLTFHGHNVHRPQRQLSKFLMRYWQFASHAYCGASVQDGVAAGKGFLCAPF